MGEGDMPMTCQANIVAVKEFVRAEINGLERRLEEKYGRARERDQGLEGAIKNLDTLVRSEFSAGRQRMENIEDWLQRQSDESKSLEKRIWNGEQSIEGRIRTVETAIPKGLDTRLRCVEKKQSLHWGWHAGIAAGVSLMVAGIMMVFAWWRIFPPI